MKKKKKGNNKTGLMFPITIVLTVVLAIGGLLLLKAGEPIVSSNASEISITNQPTLGDKIAPVQIVSFGDYKCPACQAWDLNILPQLDQTFIQNGEANYTFINYPFIGQDSNVAAQISEIINAKYDSTTFWNFHNMMYNLQGPESEEWASLDKTVDLIKANKLNIDTDNLKKLYNDGYKKENVTKDLSIANNVGVNATPTVFINGHKVQDPYNIEKINDYINEQLKAGK